MREYNQLLTPFSLMRHFAAQLMKHCREGQSEGIAQGMRGAGCSDRFFRMAERLIGTALIPQDPAQRSVASRAGVEAVTRTQMLS
jgi:hypothetical protein